MKMFMAYGKRVRMATAFKAYMAHKGGETFSNIADKYTKGNHLFLNAILKHNWNDVITEFNNLDPKTPKTNSFLLFGTETSNLSKMFLELLDSLGSNFDVSYHYYVSHNTKSKNLTKRIQAFNRKRAQDLVQKLVGGDAVITKVIELV